MDQKKLFRPFKKVLMRHALVHAGIMGLTLCALLVFALSFLLHLMAVTPESWVMVSVGAGGCLLGFIIRLAFGYPTQKRIAGVLDQNGLQERSGTMIAFRKESDTIYGLQRKDAAEHIKNTDPKEIKLQLSKKRLILCAVSLILAACILLIPYDILAKDRLSPEELAKQQAINQLIEDLRQQVQDAKFSDEITQQLLAIISQLQKDLMQAETQLEQAILIDQAKQDMEQVVYAGLSRIQIGAALQRFELPRQLGKAIYDGDFELVSLALDDLQTQLNNVASNNTKLKNNINHSLEASGVDPIDPLYSAFSIFVQDLIQIQNAKTRMPEQEEWDIPPEEEESITLTEAFDRLEENIFVALDEQALLEAEMDEMKVILDAGAQELTGQEQEETQPGISDVGQSGTGGSTGSGTGGEGTMGGMSGGPSNWLQTTMLEEIYDPISGSVTYGEVFAAYYAQYLEAIENGEIDEDLQVLIDRYFSSLG